MMAGDRETRRPPLIAHVIHRLDYGGLENGVINLVNSIPAEKYRHAIICLAGYSEFADRISNKDVKVYAINKRVGQDFAAHWRMWRLLRALQPTIVHTRNVGTIETAFVAMLAGVPVRVHGEHGRDMSDLIGANRKYRFLRKIMRYFIHRFIALSTDLANWLQNQVGIGESMISQVYNGVDADKFSSVRIANDAKPWGDFADDRHFVIGTVGRMQSEKDQVTLVKAFVALVNRRPDIKNELRLVLVGDGPLRAVACSLLEDAGLAGLVWAPGNRPDVNRILRHLNLFVLPSLIEGISNTILEAMASGTPVLATAVGGNAELVIDGETGTLVSAKDVNAMSQAMETYFVDRDLGVKHSKNARKRVEAEFSLQSMVNRYIDIYDALCAQHGLRT